MLSTPISASRVPYGSALCHSALDSPLTLRSLVEVLRVHHTNALDGTVVNPMTSFEKPDALKRVGQAEEDLTVDFVGEPLTIAFNPGYLTDGLASLHSDRVTFGFTTPSKPAVLRPAGDDGAPSGAGPFSAITTEYVYLLMPVRLPG